MCSSIVGSGVFVNDFVVTNCVYLDGRFHEEACISNHPFPSDVADNLRFEDIDRCKRRLSTECDIGALFPLIPHPVDVMLNKDLSTQE